MNRERFAFTALGKPRPQGSKNPFVNQHTGRVHLVESSKTLGPWRQVVAAAAREAWPTGTRPWDFPVGLSLTFVFARPSSHYGTGRNSDQLKGRADPWPVSQGIGDLDKLVRAICDAITGVVVVDDKQVCTIGTLKVYGVRERVDVVAARLAAPLPDPVALLVNQ